MKRVLVLSGDSYVGSHVVQLFHNSGDYEVGITLSHKHQGIAAVSPSCHHAFAPDTGLAPQLDSTSQPAAVRTTRSVPTELQSFVQHIVPNYITAPYDFTGEVVSYDVIVAVLDENDDDDCHNANEENNNNDAGASGNVGVATSKSATKEKGGNHTSDNDSITANGSARNSYTDNDVPSISHRQGDHAVEVDSVLEAESAIRALQGTHFDVEKTFVLVSSVLTWADTTRQECVQQRRARREERAQQRTAFLEEFGSDAELPDELRDDDETNETNTNVNTKNTDSSAGISAAQNDNNKNIDYAKGNTDTDNKDDEDCDRAAVDVDDASVEFEKEMRAMNRVYDESQYSQRVPHPRYHRWRQLERLVKRANSATVHSYVIAAGLAYGGLFRGGLLDDLLTSAWKDGPMRQYGLGDNTLAMVHVCDLAKLVYRIGGAYDILTERYLLAVDRGRVTVRELMQAVQRGVGGRVVRLASFEESVSEVQKQWGSARSYAYNDDNSDDTGDDNRNLIRSYDAALTEQKNQPEVTNNSGGAQVQGRVAYAVGGGILALSAPVLRRLCAYADDEEDVDEARETALRESTLRRLRDSYAAHRSQHRIRNAAKDSSSTKNTSSNDRRASSDNGNRNDNNGRSNRSDDLTIDSKRNRESGGNSDIDDDGVHGESNAKSNHNNGSSGNYAILSPALAAHLLSDIALEPVAVLSYYEADMWTAVDGFVAHIHSIAYEFAHSHRCCAIRRVIAGPPLSGAADVAAVVARQTTCCCDDAADGARLVTADSAARDFVHHTRTQVRAALHGLLLRRLLRRYEKAHSRRVIALRAMLRRRVARRKQAGRDNEPESEEDDENSTSHSNTTNNSNNDNDSNHAVYNKDDESDEDDEFYVISEDEDADEEAKRTRSSVQETHENADSETDTDGAEDDEDDSRPSQHHRDRIAVRIVPSAQPGEPSYVFANDRHRDIAAAAARITELHLRGRILHDDESEPSEDDEGVRPSSAESDLRAIERGESEDDDDDDDETDDAADTAQYESKSTRARRANRREERQARDVRERIRIAVLRQEYALCLRVLALKKSNINAATLATSKRSSQSVSSLRQSDSDSDNDSESDSVSVTSVLHDSHNTTHTYHKEQSSSNTTADESVRKPHFADVALAFMMRWRLRQLDCRNRGFVISGFPQTVQQACMLFYEDDSDAEKHNRIGGSDRAVANAWQRAAIHDHILPPRQLDDIPPPLDASFPLPRQEPSPQSRHPQQQRSQGQTHSYDESSVSFPVFAEAEEDSDSEGKPRRLRRVAEQFFPDDVVFLQASDQVLCGMANIYAHVVQSASLTNVMSHMSTEAEPGTEKGDVVLPGPSPLIIIQSQISEKTSRTSYGDDDHAEDGHDKYANHSLMDHTNRSHNGRNNSNDNSSNTAILASESRAYRGPTDPHRSVVTSATPVPVHALPFARGIADFQHRLAHYRHHHRVRASPAESLLTWFMTVQTNRVPGWTTAHLHITPLPGDDDEEEGEDDMSWNYVNNTNKYNSQDENGDEMRAIDEAEAWRTARVTLLAAPVPSLAAMRRVAQVCLRRQQQSRTASTNLSSNTLTVATATTTASNDNDSGKDGNNIDISNSLNSHGTISKDSHDELAVLAAALENSDDALTSPCGVVDVVVYTFACNLSARLRHPSRAVSDESTLPFSFTSNNILSAATAGTVPSADEDSVTDFSAITTMMHDGRLGALSQPPPPAAMLEEAAELDRLLRKERVLSAEALSQRRANVQRERHMLRFMQIEECCHGDAKVEKMKMQEYLMEYVLPSLTPVMTRLAELRPEDPITVLANLLFASKRQTEL